MSGDIYLCFEKYQKNISTNQIKQGSDPSPPTAMAGWKKGGGKNNTVMLILSCCIFMTAEEAKFVIVDHH